MSKILVAIASLGLVGLIVIHLIGRTSPRSHSTSVTQAFEVPADELFRAAVDLDGWPHWRSDVDRVQHLEGPGFRAEIQQGSDTVTYGFDGDFERLTLTATILTEDLPYGGQWTISVVPTSATTSDLTVQEDGFVDPPLWRFMSKYVIGHETTALRFIEDLRRVCGAGVCSTQPLT